MAGGAPTKYTKELARKIICEIELGANRDDAAMAWGVCARTLQRWMEQHPEFCRGVHEADAKAAVDHEQVVGRAGRAGDWKASLAWLQAKRQKIWGQKTRQEITGADGAPLWIGVGSGNGPTLSPEVEAIAKECISSGGDGDSGGSGPKG